MKVLQVIPFGYFSPERTLRIPFSRTSIGFDLYLVRLLDFHLSSDRGDLVCDDSATTRSATMFFDLPSCDGTSSATTSPATSPATPVLRRYVLRRLCAPRLRVLLYEPIMYIYECIYFSTDCFTLQTLVSSLRVYS